LEGFLSTQAVRPIKKKEMNASRTLEIFFILERFEYLKRHLCL
jgi:hypothetical protein